MSQSKSPYTIKLFVPDGNPESCKIITKMNWTGQCLEISRSSWDIHKKRDEFNQAGVYVLIGYDEETDKPRYYIGQGDGVKNRIDSHAKNKLFWDRVLVFVSSNRGLNRAHITWLEWSLIKIAGKHQRCVLDNSVQPNEPILTEYEKADTKEFLDELLNVLPIINVNVFQEPKKLNIDFQSNPNPNPNVTDTIVVPAQSEGFNRVFLGENAWYAIRIAGGKLDKIKYIAAYQTSPVSAITHLAEVQSIEPYGDGGKYKLIFRGNANKIDPIPFDNNLKSGSMQSARYTSYKDLQAAKVMSDLF